MKPMSMKNGRRIDEFSTSQNTPVVAVAGADRVHRTDFADAPAD